MDGEVTMEPIGVTLERLAANPDECAILPFPALRLELVLHSAGDGEWDMITRSKTRGVIDVSRLNEERLLFRMKAAVMVEGIALEAKARTAAAAAPKLVSDVEEFLASQKRA